MHGLGLTAVERNRPLGGLSGGEQARVHLASVLAANSEVLLLDEPTNHLDDAALSWLEGYLRSRRGTTVVVSHDRVFLEQVTTGLIEVDADRRTLVRYGTGYAGYLAERAAARQRWEQAYEQWQAELDRLREVAATTARQVAPGRAIKDRNGQRQRLALARLFSEPADLLLLDEPTNHLSLGLVEELGTALEEYQGAVVVVSHDRRLRRRWSGQTRELA